VDHRSLILAVGNRPAAIAHAVDPFQLQAIRGARGVARAEDVKAAELDVLVVSRYCRAFTQQYAFTCWQTVSTLNRHA
jgi:hypothetical protein